MKELFELGKELWKLKRELGLVVAKEDFNRAIELKRRIKELENQRDKFDALYETARYE
jgi:centrosomal protein CEP104